MFDTCCTIWRNTPVRGHDTFERGVVLRVWGCMQYVICVFLLPRMHVIGGIVMILPRLVQNCTLRRHGLNHKDTHKSQRHNQYCSAEYVGPSRPTFHGSAMAVRSITCPIYLTHPMLYIIRPCAVFNFLTNTVGIYSIFTFSHRTPACCTLP
jgi:hypothetical protein